MWYSVTVAITHKEIGKHSERMIKTKPFINKSNWKEQIFYQKKIIAKNFEKNDLTIAPNVFYFKKEKYILFMDLRMELYNSKTTTCIIKRNNI